MTTAAAVAAVALGSGAVLLGVLGLVARVRRRRRRHGHRRRSSHATAARRSTAAPSRPSGAAVEGQPLPAVLRPAHGSFPLDVVGESSYGRNLRRIAGGAARRGTADRVVIATLVCERDNSFDTKAVRVDIGDRTVGQLSQNHARAYRARLAQLGEATTPRTCEARIRRVPGASTDRRHEYAVRLALQLRDDAVEG